MSSDSPSETYREAPPPLSEDGTSNPSSPHGSPGQPAKQENSLAADNSRGNDTVVSSDSDNDDDNKSAKDTNGPATAPSEPTHDADASPKTPTPQRNEAVQPVAATGAMSPAGPLTAPPAEPEVTHVETHIEPPEQAFGNMSFIAPSFGSDPTHVPVAETRAVNVTTQGAGKASLAASSTDSKNQPRPTFGRKVDIPSTLRPTEYCSVPWSQRTPHDDASSEVNFIGCFAMTPHVMLRIEYAVRIAAVGILPAAVVAYNPSVTKLWVVPSLIVTMVVIAAALRVGSGVSLIWQGINAILLSVAIAEIIIAIDPMRHWVLFYGLYALVNVLVASFTAGFVSKLTLFFVTIHFILADKGLLEFDGDTRKYMFPLYFAQPVLVGLALALAVPLIPFPRTHRGKLQDELKAIFSSLTICFMGASDSLWTESPLERRVFHARIRAVRGSLRAFLDAAYADLDAMAYEPWPTRIFAKAKRRLALAEELLSALDGMLSYVALLTRSGSDVDGSDRAQVFGHHFKPSMTLISEYCDEYLVHMHELGYDFTEHHKAKLDVAMDLANCAFAEARARAFMDDPSWTESEAPQAAFPFLGIGYYLFNYGAFIAGLRSYDHDLEDGREEEGTLSRALLWPLRRIGTVFSDMASIARLERPMLLRLREAVKLSFAMTTAVALLLFLGASDPAGGGAVIGFVKEANPAITVLASMDFVMGTVLGSVLGYLAATWATNLTELVAYMCVLAFLTGFMRTGSRYGALGFLSMFFALASMAPGPSNTLALLETIQQNVAAMLWLGITHVVLFPLWPSDVVADDMQEGFELMQSMLKRLLAAIETGTSDLSDVEADRAALLALLAKQHAGIDAAVQEPSLKRLPYPAAEAQRLVRALSETTGLIAPVIWAVKVEAKWSKEDNNDALLPSRVITALRLQLPQVIVDIETLLRAVEACECNIELEMTAKLLGAHSELQASLLDANEAATAAFNDTVPSTVKSGVLSSASSPFRMPAVHTIMHFIGVLGPHLHRLLTDTVELRRKRLLRG